MADELTLECPIRGILKAKAKSADGLKPSEEKLRIEAIRHLIAEGYPPDHIKVEAVIKKFGHGGKNSFRADLAVLDVPVVTVRSGDVEELLAHAVLLGEVKRDNKDAEQARSTQVEPMLDFASRTDCIALYWDDVEQRLFWQEHKGGKREKHEGSLALLPSYGDAIAVVPLTFADIEPTDSLLSVMKRIEDILHMAALAPEVRYGVMLQLLLAKLNDEHAHEGRPDAALGIQDPVPLGTPPAEIRKNFNAILAKAVAYYGKHLPRSINNTVPVTGEVLSEVLQVLAPVKIIASKQRVIQDFYMYFAKHLYKWEMAQYFTPISLTEFIVSVLAPQFGEHIKDPACGSADFLTAAFRVGRQFDPKYADFVWGADKSPSSVQVAVLNMLLNGDGKSNIKEEDSLEKVGQYTDEYDILVCNPPFGGKIVERKPAVLKQYDLGHEWKTDEEDDQLVKQPKLLSGQEAGLLFVEGSFAFQRGWVPSRDQLQPPTASRIRVR